MARVFKARQFDAEGALASQNYQSICEVDLEKCKFVVLSFLKYRPTSSTQEISGNKRQDLSMHAKLCETRKRY